MMDIGSRAVLLSGHEFLILMYKKEIDGIMLPAEISDLAADELQLKSAMAELITDGYLIPGKNGLYRMSPHIEEIVDTMAGATHTYVIEELQNLFSPCYLYRKNRNVAALSMDARHRGWVKAEFGRPEAKAKEISEFPDAKIQMQRFKAGEPEPDRVFSTDNASCEEILGMIMEE